MKDRTSIRAWLLLFLAALVCNTGCSGINASKSFSPLDFLLPGLLQNQPQKRGIPEEQDRTFTIALRN